jgi:ATP-dependent exoDNAse (exonuclease V) beta subunit
MDDFSLRAFPPPKISFAGISDFKGLENSAIILTDLTAEHLRREEPSVLYVGMSRAKAYLVMILERATD